MSNDITQTLFTEIKPISRKKNFFFFYSFLRISFVMSRLNMGITQFDFSFNGTQNEFLNKLNMWVNTTREGKRYTQKTPSFGGQFMIQRGKGFLSPPIFLEFLIHSEKGSTTTATTHVTAYGYVRGLVFIVVPRKLPIAKDSLRVGLPRRNGWNDMMKILTFLGVQKYNLRKI